MALPKILALDLATRIGWACGAPDEEPVYGSHTLPSASASLGRFGDAYDQWLLDRLDFFRPGLVIFEAPFVSGTGNANTARKLMGLCWQTEIACYRRETQCLEHGNTSLKKFFTGNGRAEKADMMAACRRLGWNPKDDNAADALALWANAVHVKAPRHAARFQLGALSSQRAA
ncbi:crossover junction endodeoxyribonuclease RuvC [Methylobacterium oxalidis]|uniref:crossover junction endodeoxyribonuclease RuvC n=1 Tax=Methylobacterium oxalidis TaxID=944322 RepID=UPI003314A2B3